MEKFIDFVIDLANDELYDFFDGDAKAYFLGGLCFEFAKILKEYIKESQIIIDTKNAHCGVLYEGNNYDASKRPDKKYNFTIANEEDIKYMENRFGIPEKKYIYGKTISQYLIDEIKECNIDYILEELEGDER